MADARTDFGMAPMRVMIGAMYAAHGAQKLFTMHVAGVAGFFGPLGIPAPHAMALFISCLEFAGGILLALGAGTRVFAFLFACEMAGAIWFVHGSKGFFLPMGWEYAAVLISACIALLLIGPGRLSVDALVARGKR